MTVLARPMPPARENECIATGQDCHYAPEGPKGEMQCKYCGAEPNEVETDKA